MSRNLIVRRRDLGELQEAFSRAAVVNRTPAEDVDTLRRFKYACGRNYLTIARVFQKTGELQRKMVKPNPEFQKFQRAQNELALKHCLKDDKGEPLYVVDKESGATEYRFTAAGEVAMQNELDALEQRYAGAIRARKKNAEQIEALLDMTVEIELYTFPFERVPELVSGGFLAAIAPMLIGAPGPGALEPWTWVLRERSLPAPHWCKRCVARWLGLALVPGYSAERVRIDPDQEHPLPEAAAAAPEGHVTARPDFKHGEQRSSV